MPHVHHTGGHHRRSLLFDGLDFRLDLFNGQQVQANADQVVADVAAQRHQLLFQIQDLGGAVGGLVEYLFQLRRQVGMHLGRAGLLGFAIHLGLQVFCLDGVGQHLTIAQQA